MFRKRFVSEKSRTPALPAAKSSARRRDFLVLEGQLCQCLINCSIHDNFKRTLRDIVGVIDKNGCMELSLFVYLCRRFGCLAEASRGMSLHLCRGLLNVEVPMLNVVVC